MLDAAAELERRAQQLRRSATDINRRHDARERHEIKTKFLEAAADALTDAKRPISEPDMRNAVEHGRAAVLWTVNADTGEIWIRDALDANTRFKRTLRDRKIMRRFLAGRSNTEISKEFGLSASQIGRIISRQKQDALRAD